ncbi:hypothetical protein FRC11_006422 [Ceratobasidium sp. 423]|nr:hypothetical protein FRC11_006422 [Ceratobasidium sp. 423]
MSNQKSTQALTIARLNRIATAGPTKRESTPIARLAPECNTARNTARNTAPQTPLLTSTKRKMDPLPFFDSPGSISISSDSSGSATTASKNATAGTHTDISFDPIPFKVVSKRLLPHGNFPGVIGSISPDHRFICTVGSDGMVSILETTSGSLLGCLNFGGKQGATSVTWFSGTQFFIGCKEGCVLLARLVFESRLAEGSRLAAVTVIGSSTKGGSPTALSFDYGLGLLAVVTSNALDIWRCVLDSEHKRTWEFVDGGHASLRSVGYTACFFGGHTDKFLFIGTNDGYALWSQQTKKLEWNVVGTYPIRRCAVSPGGRILAATKSNFEVLIWPVQTSGISCSERSTFVIPTGRDWITGGTFPPINFVDDNSILTADPVGTVYFVTARAEVLDKFDCGLNYHIRSLFWTPAYLYALALGPGGTTVIANFTDCESRLQSNYKQKPIDLTDGDPFIVQDLKLPTPKAPQLVQATVPSNVIPEKRSQSCDYDWKFGFNRLMTLYENTIDLKLMMGAFIVTSLLINFDSVLHISLSLTKLFGFTILIIIDFTLAFIFYILALVYKPYAGNYEFSTELPKGPQ